MSTFNTLNFLPEIFRTTPNKKFIHATLDQLVIEPSFVKVSGFIGRTFSPTFQYTNTYINEISSIRQSYQLEAGVVNYDTTDVIFYANYIDLLNQIDNLGGISQNQTRLFESETYTYNPMVDYDKLINYQNYYWLTSFTNITVPININNVPTNLEYTLIRNEQNRAFQFDVTGNQNNPTLILLRGGTYTFNVNQNGYKFWIQTTPDINGLVNNLQNLSNRDVFGVNNNGVETGTVIFNVPLYDTQSYFTNMPVLDPVNVGVNTTFAAINGQTIATLATLFDGINLEFSSGKSLVFLTNDFSDAAWTDKSGHMIPVNYRASIFTITLTPPTNNNGTTNFLDVNNATITLQVYQQLTNNSRFLIIEGARNGNIEFYYSGTQILQIPALTAQLDTFYYSDGSNPSFTGTIKVINIDNFTINVENDIIGKLGYSSPNGITLSNGMLIAFDKTVIPASYSSDSYFVEGVGTAISLTPFESLITPELDYTNAGVPFDSAPFDVAGFDQRLNYPITPDYCTIKRNSADGNPWSRSNRWVHIDVLQQASAINNTPLTLDSNNIAKRPIIEFNANIKLFNYGRRYIPNVHFLDFTTTDALTQVEGIVAFNLSGINVLNIINANSYTIGIAALDGNQQPMQYMYALQNGDKIRFDQSSSPAQYAGRTFLVSNIGIGNILLTEVIDFYYDLQITTGLNIVFVNDIDPTVRNALYQVNIVNANRQVATNQNTITIPLTFIQLIKQYTFVTYDSIVPINAITVPLLPYNATSIADLQNPTLRTIKPKFSTNNNTYYVNVGVNALLSVVSYDYGVVIGTNYWFDGTTWQLSQTKTTINQAPLFDMMDNNSVMLSDGRVYQGSSFSGTKIFSYNVGTGLADAVLGFPLTYQSINNIGDIEFINNIDTDTFTYINQNNRLLITQNINTSFIALLSENNSLTPTTIWNKTIENSKQYQIFNMVYNGVTPYFIIDIYPDIDNYYSNLKVFVNYTQLQTNQYQLRLINNNNTLAVYITATLSTNDAITILVYNSSQTSNIGYYQTPNNLDFNPLNETFTTLTLGQIRNHLVASANESKNIIGNMPGNSNLRDVNITSFKGVIQQQSASLLYPYEFLLNPDLDFMSSLAYAEREYIRFKNKILESFPLIVAQNITNASDALDYAIGNINIAKNSSMPWYFSDMVPYGDNVTIYKYQVTNLLITSYQISKIYDNSYPSNIAILVYNNGTQMTYGIDYTFSQQYPSILITSTSISVGDQLKIVQYNNTDGCYIPETPSKMGLYPAFVPKIYVDDSYSTPITMIHGHDGSISPAYGDLRDQIMLEFELRIYNNIKMKYSAINIDLASYIPGYFRKTEYNASEYYSILSTSFYKWLGDNKVPFGNNDWFVGNNTWTWNYSNFVDKFGYTLPGFWRGIYSYYFDTDKPHISPWEMLGFSSMPIWWISEYGDAPWTGGNDILWTDLENGYVRGMNIYLPQYTRPGLSKIIPVDASGKLLPPDQFLVGVVNALQANMSFMFGDGSPIESAWKKSSSYPFAIQRAISLMKPAKYFNLFINNQDYFYNYMLGQYQFQNSNGRLTPYDLTIHGQPIANSTSVIRSSGYLNWVTDYLRHLGKNPFTTISSYFNNNISIKLNYKMGAYADKNYIQIIAEQLSVTNETNTRLVNTVAMPNENYNILLHKSATIATLIYSAIVIEKTNSGLIVNGYDLNHPVFSTIPSNPSGGSYDITIGDSVATIYTNGLNVIKNVLYGTSFTQTNDLVDFIISYGRYLSASGFQFANFNSDLQTTADWTVSIQELLTWINQNWPVGSVLLLSPTTSSITLTYLNAQWCADEITSLPSGSKLLNINQQIIKRGNFSVDRTDEDCTVSTLDGSSIGLLSINMVQYEHCCIFDNITIFNDIIYQPSIGNRQFRLKLIGSKVGNWDGQLSPNGFVYSSGIIPEWQPNTDYSAGDIVQYKNIYYTALQVIPAMTQFILTPNWSQINATQIQTGLLQNFAFNAAQFTNFYDVDTQSYDENKDKFSMGLIGFRERQYLTDIGITPTSQVKFYQGFLKQKGTMNAVTALTSAQFGNMSGNIEVYEEWALRVGSYGAIDSTQFFEISLDQNTFTQDPIVMTLLNNGVTLPGNITAGNTIVGINQTNLHELPKQFTTTPVKNRSDETNYINDIKTAGYVNLNDIDYTIYDITNYQEFDLILSQITDGIKIWVAKDFNLDWNVRRVEKTTIVAIVFQYQLDGTAQVTFNLPHNAVVNDLIIIYNFNQDLDGIYKVMSITDNLNIIVDLTTAQMDIMLSVPQIIAQQGINDVYRLVSLRLPGVINIGEYNPVYGWLPSDKIWVDNDYLNYDTTNQNGWQVFNYVTPWAIGNVAHFNDILHGNAAIFGNVFVTSLLGNTIVNVFGNNANSTISNSTISLGGSITSAISGDYDFVAFKSNVNSVTTYGICFIDNQQLSTTIKTNNPVLSSMSSEKYSVFSTSYSPLNSTYYHASYESFLYSFNTGGTFTLDLAINSNIGHNDTDSTFGKFTAISNNSQIFYSVSENNIYHYVIDTTTNTIIANTRIIANTNVINNNISVQLSLATGVAASNDGQFLPMATGVATSNDGQFLAISNYNKGEVSLFNMANLNSITTTVFHGNLPTSYYGFSIVFDDNDNLLITEPLLPVANSTIKSGITHVYTSDSSYSVDNSFISPLSNYEYYDSSNPMAKPIAITSPEQFGRKIKTYGNLVCISATAASYSEVISLDNNTTTFDLGTTLIYFKNTDLFPTNYIKIMSFDVNVTTFDHGTTTVSDNANNIKIGIVYVFNITDGQCTFLQSLSVINDLNFGQDFSISADRILVTSTNYNSSTLYYFDNPNKYDHVWQQLRTQQPQTDLDSIYKTFIYNSNTESLISTLDIYDPKKGKFLGSALQELNFITEIDPAIYTNTSTPNLTVNANFSWADEHVGKLWLDCSQFRFIEYEQDSLLYRINNWGQLFPNSQINVLEWVKSINPPDFYSGDGTVYYSDLSTYATSSIINPITNITLVWYYFWVNHKTSIDQTWRRTSASDVIQMIQYPLLSNVPMISAIRNDTLILFNTQPLLSTNTSVLHFEYKLVTSPQLIHNEYQLVQKGNPNANIPNSILNKMIDSLVGEDASGNILPDIQLKTSQKYGTSIRPRQSMFINRLMAVKNMVMFANTQLMTQPVALISNFELLNDQQPAPTNFDPFNVNMTISTYQELSYIDISTMHPPARDSSGMPVYQAVLVLNDINNYNNWSIYNYLGGAHYSLFKNQAYNTTNYWNYVDWVADTYDSSTEVTFTVNTMSEIPTLLPQVGNTIKILNSGSNYTIYSVNQDGSLTLVAAQNGTIQLNNALWDYQQFGIGFGNNYAISGYAHQPITEVRNIINALKNNIFIQNLSGAFNNLFFILLEYALSEQKYIDWAFKTSFITVKQNLHSLEQYPTYSPDNHSFYTDYINEVKPYRTVLRQQTIAYNALDMAQTHMTDFDLPSYYDSNLGWRSPSGELASDAAILTNNSIYHDWNDNHFISIQSVLIENNGYNYSYAPTISVVGGNGTGGILTSFVDGTTQSVTNINIVNGGSYLSTPTILPYGDGTTISTVGNITYFDPLDGTNQTLKCFPVMKNMLVRNMNIFLKFDRISYAPISIIWTVGTKYTPTDLVVFKQNIYKPIVPQTTPTYFDPMEYTAISQADAPSYIDRVLGYYIPMTGMFSTNVAEKSTGVVYTGIPVTGVNYGTYKSLPIDTNIGNGQYTDLLLGTKLQEVNVTSHAYVDYWTSHAPEEFLPGLMYDNLSIRVFTVATSGSSPKPTVTIPSNTIGVDGQFASYLSEYQPYAFRIVKNLHNETTRNDCWSFYAIQTPYVSSLANDLNMNDTEIYVVNISAFSLPVTGQNSQIYINGELIEYNSINLTTKTLSGLHRGTWGTGTPLVHKAGSIVESINPFTALPITKTTTPYSQYTWTFDIYNNTNIVDIFIRKYNSYLPWGNNY